MGNVLSSHLHLADTEEEQSFKQNVAENDPSFAKEALSFFFFSKVACVTYCTTQERLPSSSRTASELVGQVCFNYMKNGFSPLGVSANSER